MTGKRGQFYLIAAIIIVLVLYSLATRFNTFQELPRFTDFNELSGNYINEVAKIVNHGIYKNIANIQGSLITPFTQNFLEYARTRDPNIGLVYVYGQGDATSGVTIIENHLPGEVVVYNSGVDGGVLFDSEADTINEIGLKIGGEEFVHNVPVKLGSFSSSYFSATIPSSVDTLKLDVAGTPFLFNPGGGNLFFDVIIKTSREDSPGTINTKVCKYDSSLGGWQGCL